jgi:hypothetical protein
MTLLTGSSDSCANGAASTGFQAVRVYPPSIHRGFRPNAAAQWAAGYTSMQVAVQNFGCWYVCAAEQERPEESLFALAESAHKHGSVHERVWRFI